MEKATNFAASKKKYIFFQNNIEKYHFHFNKKNYAKNNIRKRRWHWT